MTEHYIYVNDLGGIFSDVDIEKGIKTAASILGYDVYFNYNAPSDMDAIMNLPNASMIVSGFAPKNKETLNEVIYGIVELQHIQQVGVEELYRMALLRISEEMLKED